MFVVDIRADSRATLGSRRSNRPSTSWERAPTPRATLLGTWNLGAGRPVQAASRAEERAHPHVLAADDVAASDRATLEGQQVSGCQVVHMDHVQGGVDECRDLAVEEFE